jgi:energy-coupling factor transporter ATP-binding protein EcfA2
MDITFAGHFKSIRPFEWKNLPMFSILTGTNGSGKSQLLQLLYDTIINNQNQPARVTFVGDAFKQGEVTFLTSEWLLESTYAIKLTNIQQEVDNLFSQFTQPHNTIHSPKLNFYFNELADKLGKPRNQFTADEFNKVMTYDYYQNEQQITHQIARIFFNYYIDRVQLKYDGKTNEEIELQLGPKPWLVLNDIMERAKIPFEFNSPEGLSIKDSFKITITDKVNDCPIEFADLSSGEKVLVSLVIYLYNSQEKKFFPRFLLMDEPDAHLHPSMAKQFLDVIGKVFVTEFNIRVIMCTHSPSTVALAPEEALYVVNKRGQRVEKTTKDKALKILTTGVPSFSVLYENRRQVFVESPFDVMFYEKFYQRLADYLTPEVSLSFISSGESRTNKHGGKVSNCEQVMNITQTLREAGNKFVWGIVDWDGSNSDSDFIKVLGQGNRYSIESYILDPVLLGAFLIREKLVKLEAVKLQPKENYTSLKGFDQRRWQDVVDFVVQAVAAVSTQPASDNIACRLLNGIEITIPQWYLHHQGHELEDLVLKAFPALHSFKKGKEEALKLEIINKVVDDMPELTSVDLVTVLKTVQAIA